jgi:endonuclease/exonuclease/phosphatase (EEP) superfamily protein YafD
VLRRAIQLAAAAYLASVLAVALLLGWVGESWWVTTVGLYLPRVVLAAPLPVLAPALWWLRSWRLLVGQGVGLLVVAFPLMGLNVPSPGFPDRSAPTLRVLSYNVDSSLGGVDAVVAEVERYSPDVAFLQEIGQTVELTRAMQARYPTVRVSGQFLSASRYPIVSEVDPERFPFDGRQRTPRFLEQTMETTLGRVAFYNMHPISPRDDFYALRGRGLRREILSGHLFSGDAGPNIRANAELRARQVQSSADAAARESGPAIIAGDTNLPGLSVVFRRHLSRFQDGFVKAGWGFGYTYPDDKRPGPWMRIDRILANDALRFVRFRVGQSRASDHLCVVADLQLR